MKTGFERTPPSSPGTRSVGARSVRISTLADDDPDRAWDTSWIHNSTDRTVSLDGEGRAASASLDGEGRDMDSLHSTDFVNRQRHSQRLKQSLKVETQRRQNRTCPQKVVESALYQFVMMCCVLAQAVGMGVEMQLQMDHHADVYHASSTSEIATVPTMYWFTFCLNSVFCLDLAARIVAWKLLFFSQNNVETFAWNVFDTCLVLLSLPDYVDVGSSRFAVFRCVRLLRALRIMRMVAFFSKLKKMINSFFSGTAQLLEVCALLFLVLYVFSVAFMQGASDELDTYGPIKLQTLYNSSMLTGHHESTGHVIPLIYYFSSIRTTMVNLFAAITGGSEWLQFLKPLMDASSLYYWMSVFFVFFFIFGFMNVVTGMFVDRAAAQIKRTDEELSKKNLAWEAHRVEQRIRSMIGMISDDIEVEIDLSQLVNILKDAEIQDWLEKTGVDITRDVEHVISMLIPADEATCTMQRFLRIFRLLRGEAKSFDLSLLLFESRAAFDMSVDFNRRQQQDLRRVLDRINRIGEIVCAPRDRAAS